jgi:ABC-type multidrug transport system ATPase subunit
LPGQTLFIMGSSGCGKTSLLNLLSDRISVGRGDSITGAVKMNDIEDLNNDVFGKIGAYVMQDDILFSYFTPREALRFAARLKLTIPFEDQDRRVENLL